MKVPFSFANVTTDEERFDRVGYVPDFGLIIVVYTVRDYDGEESYRIISARPASKTEEAAYVRGY